MSFGNERGGVRSTGSGQSDGLEKGRVVGLRSWTGLRERVKCGRGFVVLASTQTLDGARVIAAVVDLVPPGWNRERRRGDGHVQGR